jgi:undecaprenyl-phosphate 4-deoxy-4-formamido-L-arabinose transferase
MEYSIDITVLIPLLNEEENLTELNDRLEKSLSSMGKSYEIIYINDGSTDRTQNMLEGFRERNPHVKIIEFNRNYGQHMALLAGFGRASGRVTISIDGDLQNPPEEIPKLVAKAEEGYDVVAGRRKGRQDSIFRRIPSWLMNKSQSHFSGIKLRDYGCMLRAYSRQVVDSINLCQESSSYVPALANNYAIRITEIDVHHDERKRGVSKYNPLKLLKLYFDFMTFSFLPIQYITMFGVIVALFGFAFAAFLFIRRLIVGPESEGLFTLFAILFFFVGVQIFFLGVIGEYIGRTFQEVRRRPRYIVKKELL